MTRISLAEADLEAARAAWDRDHRCAVCGTVTGEIRSRGGVLVCPPCIVLIDHQAAARAAAELVDNTSRGRRVAAWLADHPDHAHLGITATRPPSLPFARP